jgi:hypothetical protein
LSSTITPVSNDEFVSDDHSPLLPARCSSPSSPFVKKRASDAGKRARNAVAVDAGEARVRLGTRDLAVRTAEQADELRPRLERLAEIERRIHGDEPEAAGKIVEHLALDALQRANGLRFDACQ